LFSEYLCDGRYGWAAACEEEFGPGSHPVPAARNLDYDKACPPCSVVSRASTPCWWMLLWTRLLGESPHLDHRAETDAVSVSGAQIINLAGDGATGTFASLKSWCANGAAFKLDPLHEMLGD
jgi:hypothetical protein